MRLLDVVARTTGSIRIVVPDGSFRELPGADVVADQVASCPVRYVLEDDVAALCTRVAFEADSVIGNCLDILREPARQFWLEFDAIAHAAELASNGVSNAPVDGVRQRLGVLVTFLSGNAGTLDFLWQGTDAPGAELAPMRAEFDLSDPCMAKSSDESETFGVALAGLPWLTVLFERVRFRLNPAWRAYYLERTDSDAAFRAAVEEMLRPLCSTVPLPFAFMLLLMTGRALRGRESDLSRLNRARARRGRHALLDHVEMRLSLETHGAPSAENAAAGAVRAKSRLHLVRGHLVRRGVSVFWRSTHLRGSAEMGVVASRTVTMSLAGAGQSQQRRRTS